VNAHAKRYEVEMITRAREMMSGAGFE